MRLRLVWLCTLCVGCAVPRSGLLMQGADLMGKGGAEVGLGAGFIYSTASQSGVTLGTFQLPLLEANARIGLTDMFDVNLHAGPNGLAPGLKIGYSLGSVDLAALPSFAIGVYRYNTSGGFSGTAQTMLNFEGGLRLMASLTDLGGFFGFGYWFQYFNSGSEPSGAGGSATTTTGHNIAFNLGWGFEVGPVKVRPEVGLIINAGASNSVNGMPVQTANPTIVVMPAVTLAGGSVGKKKEKE